MTHIQFTFAHQLKDLHINAVLLLANAVRFSTQEKGTKVGVLGYLAKFCLVSRRRTKCKPLQTVEIKVKMDCDGCVRKVKNAVTSMKGVRSVEVIRKENRVTVTGYINREKVLQKVRNTGKKKAEFWPYVRYDLVAYPYAVGTYDKRAPRGYVRNVAHAFPEAYSCDIGTGHYSAVQEETLATLFSDENTNACIIM